MATVKPEPKRKQIARALDVATGVITWTFTDKTVEPLVFDPRKCTEEMRAQLQFHGSTAKIGDAAALPMGTPDAEKRAEMSGVIENLYAGIWNAVRGTAIPKVVDVDTLVAVIAGISKRNVVDVRAFVEKRDEPARRDLADSAEFKSAYIMAMAKKRPTTTVDLTELYAIPVEE